MKEKRLKNIFVIQQIKITKRTLELSDVGANYRRQDKRRSKKHPKQTWN